MFYDFESKYNKKTATKNNDINNFATLCYICNKKKTK